MRPHLAVGLPLWATQYIAQGGRTVTLGLEPRTAEELAELLARGVVIAEAHQNCGSRAERTGPVRKIRADGLNVKR